MVHEMAKPFDFHMDAFGPAPDKTSGSREGIWWFGTSTAKDVLVIANKSDETIPVTMTVYRPDGTAFKVPLSLAAHAAERLSVRDLLAAHGWTDTYGGLDIRAEKKAGYVDTIHYVVDETANFSAQLKMFDYDGKATMAERGWNKGPMWTTRAPMLALTNPDPAMKLPKGTTLHPKLYIRNTTEHSIDTSIAFNWRNEEKHGHSVGPSFTLAPLETRYVDVAELQRKNVLPLDATWSSVYISGGTKPDEIMAIAASFSDEGHYGAQTPFNDQLAFHWAGGIWVVDALHDSLTTVGNGTDHATTASLLLYTQASANAGDAVSSPVPYEWQQELGPGEHMWVNIADLVRGGKPDIHGRVLPAGLKTGTYEFKDNSHDGRGTLFEGKVIVDKTNGHATYGCMECCGYDSAIQGILAVAVGTTAAVSETGMNSCGDSGDISGYFTYWRSADTSIVTINNDGIATGVAYGSTELSGTAYNVEEDGGGADSLHCPTDNITTSGPAYTPTLTCTSVTRGQQTSCQVNSEGGPTYDNWTFSDASGNSISRQTGNSDSTWNGIAVISGTVTVDATYSDGTVMTASAQLSVSARSGWNYSAQPSTRVTSFNPSYCTSPNIPTEPVSGSPDGAACPYENINSDTVFADLATGPNQGYQYFSSEPTDGGFFNWLISSDVDNPSSEFYVAQCGNYNSQTNPDGFISGSTFDADTMRHEGGTTTSHYANYVSILQMPTLNLGTQLEAVVAAPNANFGTAVADTINSVNAGVETADGEPCGSHSTNVNAACQTDGNVNYRPFTSCHKQQELL